MRSTRPLPFSSTRFTPSSGYLPMSTGFATSYAKMAFFRSRDVNKQPHLLPESGQQGIQEAHNSLKLSLCLCGTPFAAPVKDVWDPP